ncbi:MAG: WG repeat-containing protein [Cytophagaceae bacterium]|nr:WG repeat-containing protein [Cytophagaceae bacterium]
MNCLIRKAFFCVLFISLLSTHYSALSQKGSNCPEDLVPKLGDNKSWGYANLFGQWVINPIYTKVSPYVENKAVVMKGLKYGVIDCEGNVILHPEYEKLTNFRYGKIWGMKNGLWGLLNEKGAIILEHQYSEINPIAFTELTWIKTKDNLWGLLNEEKGTMICKPQFKVAQVMSENATLVQINPPMFGVINHVNCEYLLPANLTKVKKVAAHTIIFEQQEKWGVFNELGKLVSNAEYDSIGYMKTAYDPKTKMFGQLLLIRKNNFFGLMSLNGKEIMASKYEEIAEYSSGFFKVKDKGKYGYANRTGKVYIKPMYEEASSFMDGQAIVKKDGKYGVIDIKNQFVIPAQSSSIERNPRYKYYVVKQKDNSGAEKKYFYGLNAKKITEDAFEEVMVSDSSSFMRVKKDGKMKFYNVNAKNYSFEGSFDAAEPFDFGYALVGNAGKWGVIDEKGKVIIPLNYDKVEYDWFNAMMVFKTTLAGKLGIIEKSGKVMLPNEYEFIAVSAPIYLKVKKGGKYGVIKNTGVPVTEFVYDFISNESEAPGVPEWPAIVVKKGKYGLLNEKGEEIFEPKAASILYVGEAYYAVKEKKTFGLLNSKCSNPYEPQYDDIREFGNGLAAAKKGNKWGYINKKGERDIEFTYEDAGMFINYMAPVLVNGKWGIIDIGGRLLVPAEYDKFVTMPDGTRKLFKGDKEYTVLKGGKLK